MHQRVTTLVENEDQFSQNSNLLRSLYKGADAGNISQRLLAVVCVDRFEFIEEGSGC